MTINRSQAQGNSIDNSASVYPDTAFAEFYQPGKHPDYGSLDWRALPLLFDGYQGQCYLVAIVGDRWTT